MNDAHLLATANEHLVEATSLAFAENTRKLWQSLVVVVVTYGCVKQVLVVGASMALARACWVDLALAFEGAIHPSMYPHIHPSLLDGMLKKGMFGMMYTHATDFLLLADELDVEWPPLAEDLPTRCLASLAW